MRRIHEILQFQIVLFLKPCVLIAGHMWQISTHKQELKNKQKSPCLVLGTKYVPSSCGVKMVSIVSSHGAFHLPDLQSGFGATVYVTLEFDSIEDLSWKSNRWPLALLAHICI